MELDITRFFNEACARDYSASVAELGQSAGADTWRAATDDAEEYSLLDSDEKREAFRAFILSSGGWNEAECNAFTDIALNALCIQWIADDMRDGGLDTHPVDWVKYQSEAEAGNTAGNIFQADDGKVYFYIGA